MKYNASRNLVVERHTPINITVMSVTFALSFGSAILLEISSFVAIPGLLLSFSISLVYLIVRRGVDQVTFFSILLILYALASSVVFGGAMSIFESGLTAWLGGEGRFFLYYWPFIFVTLILSPNDLRLLRNFEKILLAITLFAFCAVMLRQVGVKVYSSHHAAGAVMSALAIFNYFCFRYNPSVFRLFFLLIALVGLLGTGSRTSLLAFLISIFAQQLIFFHWRQMLIMAASIPILVLFMSSAFPAQYTRLSATFKVNPAAVVSANFERAWHADPPLESSNAWSLNTFADKQGQVNLAIRGLLWARGIVEGTKSPVFGSGFGRYNDTGRSFTQVGPVLNVATAAEYNNPSTHSSHNSFIMVFSELGAIGLGVLIAIYVCISRRCISAMSSGSAPIYVKMWSRISFGCMVSLFMAGITQHSFGAPIYGLSLMQIIGIGYAILPEKV